MTLSSDAAPPRSSSTRSVAAFAVVVIALVVVLAALLWQPPRASVGAPSLPPTSLGFQIPRKSGNASVGWTYTLNVTVEPQVQTPVPLVWGNLRVTLTYEDNSTVVYPYLPPGGTTVHVTDSAGAVIARENLSTGLWTDGYFLRIDTGQMLVVRGNVPPGTDYVHNGTDTFRGPGLVIQFSNAGQPFTLLNPFQGNWVYT